MNRRKKVAIIIPYFGNFPNYFNYWLKSALANRDFDFFIFTDNTSYKTVHNIKFINMQFEEFKNLLQRQIEFPICLNEPYKLCDYKPVYGSALQDYIKEYDFWGFGDVDLILGNLSKFITPSVLDNYEKIYELGHLTLLKNNSKCNYLWKTKHHINDAYRYDEAFKTPYICHFDETAGLTKIAKAKKINTYVSADFADIDRKKYNFFMINRQTKVFPSLFEWNNGSLNFYYKKNNIESKIEVAYAHFQKRKMEISDDQIKSPHFIIIPNKFLNGGTTEEYLNKIKIVKNYPYYSRSRRKEVLNNIKKHALQQRLYRKIFRKINRRILDKE